MTPSERLAEQVNDFETAAFVLHVGVPAFGKAHVIEGPLMCWCWPVIEEQEDGSFIVEHSVEH